MISLYQDNKPLIKFNFLTDQPKRQTLYQTSIYVPYVLDVVGLRVVANAIYCIMFTSLFPFTYATMALTGYIAGMYEFPFIQRQHTVNAVLSVGVMSIALYATQNVRAYPHGVNGVELLYMFYWCRTFLFRREVFMNICHFFNFFSWVSVAISVMISVSIYHLVEEKFHSHPLLLFIDMWVWAAVFGLAPKEDSQDNLVLLGIRRSIGWFARWIKDTIVWILVVILVYIPLMAYFVQVMTTDDDDGTNSNE
jgi:hypothetical protein